MKEIIPIETASETKTNKKKWQQTVTWNETYNAPTMHTLGTE